jgi:Lrp/AsnC family leucine-responsive transcriptional regulator
MIDGVSLEILRILQEKARIPNVEVARRVGMAPSAVLERIRKLEKQGVIDGYEVRLNPKRFGKDLVAFVFIKTVTGEDDRSVGAALCSIAEIQEVHYVAGEDAYLAKLRVSGTMELGRILREEIAAIPSVASTRTAVVLETLKETSQIPIDAPSAAEVVSEKS